MDELVKQIVLLEIEPNVFPCKKCKLSNVALFCLNHFVYPSSTFCLTFSSNQRCQLLMKVLRDFFSQDTLSKMPHLLYCKCVLRSSVHYAQRCLRCVKGDPRASLHLWLSVFLVSLMLLLWVFLTCAYTLACEFVYTHCKFGAHMSCFTVKYLTKLDAREHVCMCACVMCVCT